MKKTGFIIGILCIVSILLNTGSVIAQEEIDWLADYTNEINAGSYSFKYNFTSVDNNACKLKIEELKTDKKGKTSSEAYVFYLSDINPSALSFKASGKVINVSMETNLSQKFITSFEEGEFEGYTNKISVSMSEVAKARSFIEAVKSNIGTCKTADRSWTSHEEALTWLGDNIGESAGSGTTFKQKFSKGEKSYMVQLETETIDSKGGSKTAMHIFDLSDIDPTGVSVNVSGKDLEIDIKVRDNKNYVLVKEDEEEISFSKAVEIHSDDIEIARNIVNAFVFLSSDLRPERKVWKSYSQALAYVKDNLKEVSVGTATYKQSLDFVESTSGIVTFTSVKTDSKGTSTEEVSSFYLNNLNSKAGLNVSTSNAYIRLNTKNKNKYIKHSSENIPQVYLSSLKIYVDDIDRARDIINALEHAIINSASGIKDYTTIDKAMEWLSQGPGEVTIDSKSIKQRLRISPDMENKLELNVVTTDEGSSINERYEIYPEDVSLEELKINVSGKKMYVPLSTGKLKYVKVFKENELQNFVSGTDVLFEDVKKAKNFIAAVSFLSKNSQGEDRLVKDKTAAWGCFDSYLKKLEIGDVRYEQTMEKLDGDDCKLKFTRIETDSKGTTEYVFELMASDIAPSLSEIKVYADKLYLNLVTKDKQKLIKPYKNGEAGNFGYDFDLYVDDVLVAKKILGAFTTLAEGCK